MKKQKKDGALKEFFRPSWSKVILTILLYVALWFATLVCSPILFSEGGGITYTCGKFIGDVILNFSIYSLIYLLLAVLAYVLSSVIISLINKLKTISQ